MEQGREGMLTMMVMLYARTYMAKARALHLGLWREGGVEITYSRKGGKADPGGL